MSNTDKWKLLRRGKAGWNVDGLDSMGNKVSGSGGTLENYLQECDDDTLVYDAQEADLGSFVEFVINGPMVDITLNTREVREFTADQRSALTKMLPGLAGAFNAIATMAMVSEAGMLSHVSLDLYLDMLKAAVPGMKFGKVKDNQIQWEG